MNTATTESVKAVLGTNAKANKQRRGKWWLAFVIAGVLGAGAYVWLSPQQGQTSVSFKTTPVQTGKLVVSVTATGNLQPKNQVDIGTELSGTVAEVLVDDNDVVKKGQVLARLNTTQLNDTITKSKAALASAEANVNKATAAITQSQATLKEAETNLKRLQELHQASGGQLPAQTELDSAKATLDRAKADIASNKAAEVAAKAAVTQAKASLRSDETNLGKAIITSPIDGVVLDRAIEPGQTVAASLSAPTLFTLAEDLSQMEVEVAVDEADVGKVKEGQKAEFTVDAWAGRKYPAEITRVSLGSTTSDNVVSYVTVLAVQNTDLTLRPGMTATATIETDRRDNAVLIPNTALRFTPPMLAAPPDEAGSAPAASGSSGGFLSKLMPRPPMMDQKKRSTGTGDAEQGAKNADGTQTVWVLNDNRPTAVSVKTGISDGKMTEIVSGDLQAGMQVITESNSGGKAP